METANKLALSSSSSSLTLSSNLQEFPSLFANLNTLLLSSPNPSKPYVKNPRPPSFSSLSLSPRRNPNPSRSLLDRSLIGAAAGGIAGAFTYVCLLPIDTIKTKLQTKGAAKIYSSALDAAVKTFRSDGILGFYRGVSAVLVGSSTSSAIYFGTCEFGKAMLGKLPGYPPILIPPTAGAMGNVVSSAIMVPKELITQRMQAGAAGRSWEVMVDAFVELVIEF